MSVTLLVLAALAWLRPDSSPSAPAGERSALRGGLILFAVSAASAGAIWLLARPMGWSVDRALWIGLGAVVGLLTIARPWWFWDHYKARWLRELIGDAATAAFYLLVSGVMVWVGLFTDWTFGRH